MVFIALYVMALFYFSAGINHFWHPGFYRPMMPPWIPLPDLMIIISGIAEIAIGLGLVFEPTRRLSAWAVILLLIAVFPVHIYMYQARETVFSQIPVAIIIGRIPLQFALMYWAWLYTNSI
jgi:uncharacterized membrane protein